MTDLEICVDGLVSDRIRDMNAMVEATRQELEKRYHADAEDLTMRTLKAAQIDEDEYFGRILYHELAAILKQIKAAHGTDKTTSDGAAIEQARKQLENAQKFEGSPLEKKMNVLMGQIGIDYAKLTKEEQMTLLQVFNKSSMLKHRTKAGMRGESTGADPFALCVIGRNAAAETYTIGSSCPIIREAVEPFAFDGR